MELADANANANAPTPGTVDKWDRWGWGQWGKSSWPAQDGAQNGNWDRWGWGNRGSHAHQGPNANANAGSALPQRPEGAWGPPTPLPAANEKAPEKDVVQQATDTVSASPCGFCAEL